MTEGHPGQVLDAQALASDASWYIRSVDLTGQASIVAMTPHSYEASSFLDNRIVLPEDAQTGLVAYNALAPLFPDVGTRETAFIFHISHCGSTLLSKAIGTLPGVLSLREPVLLRWLAELRGDLGLPESRVNHAGYVQALRTALGLLARPLGELDRVVVKASSFASPLAIDILELQPRTRALVLFSRFEDFAATVLKGSGGWRDMLNLAPVRMRRLHAIAGRPLWALAGMTPGELVALNWLAEMVTLKLADVRHQGRLVWLEFDAFLAEPCKQFATVAQALGLAAGDDAGERLAASGVLDRYSKNPGRAFGFAVRQHELASVRVSQADEIARGKAWLEGAAQAHPLFRAALDQTCDLLGELENAA